MDTMRCKQIHVSAPWLPVRATIGCLVEATHVQYARLAALVRKADARGLTVDGLPQAVRRYVPREQRAAGAVAAVTRMRVVLRAESVSTFPMTIDLLSMSGGVLGVHDTAHGQRQVEFERLTGFHRCAVGLIVDGRISDANRAHDNGPCTVCICL